MDKLLRVENLNKDKILHQVSFEMKQGEMLAVMGPSGSGKSTLLYNVSGMDQPTGGKVWLGDTEITGLSEDAKADLRLHQMGFIFQQMHLISNLTLLENAAVVGYLGQKKSTKEVRERALALLTQTHVEHAKDRLPSQVSGGEAQRAAIARAMMNEPEIIFADEPTGALDSKSTDELLGVFERINQSGQTILMVTHSVKAASKAGRVLFIKDGEVFHQVYKGEQTDEQFYQNISATLTMLATGGERR